MPFFFFVISFASLPLQTSPSSSLSSAPWSPLHM
ncbi:hypothetical protein AALP_AAs60890U000300 [Arabis alpina]|uniref:Uncharacterized protein n=1 Tax=Arabis alpina TaxID=50452 RepID=A0A087FYL2_ARAAL|nr:hypothetical protein AALP_AAs60890U000300 [Arabis alpina]